jgi:plasmid maintenance system antidote protein VapI
MNMHNPPHPGEFIAKVYLEPNGTRSGVAVRSLSVYA